MPIQQIAKPVKLVHRCINCNCILKPFMTKKGELDVACPHCEPDCFQIMHFDTADEYEFHDKEMKGLI